MNMPDNGAERGVAPSSPLFASSWVALYLLLKQGLENLRDDDSQPRDDAQAEASERRH